MTAQPWYGRDQYPENIIGIGVRAPIDAPPTPPPTPTANPAVTMSDTIEMFHAELTALQTVQRQTAVLLDRLDAAADAAGRDTPKFTRTVRLLTARVEWLETRVRETGAAPVADLDVADEALLDLADAVHAGRDAEESLLPPTDQAALRTIVDAFSKLEQERDRASHEVLAISAALDSSARSDPAHVRHLSLFAAAEQRLAAVSAELGRNERSARAARERLAENDEKRTAAAPTIAVGREAREALDTRLRTRLGVETRRGALMPSWFSADLGPAPSSPDTEAAWFDAAVDALGYRLVYEVDDRTSILGPTPEPTTPAHRTTEHARLTAELNALNT